MKKWLLIGMALIIALSGALVIYSCEKTGEGESSGVIEVPEGPKIKVVYNGPPELEVSWEKLGIEAAELHLVGILINISSGTVKFSTVDFLLDGRQVAYIQGQTLEPGEQMRILKGFPGYTETTKVLEVKISGFQKLGGSAITPTEPTEPTSPEPEMTPEEMLMKWLDLMKKGEFSEAEKFFTPDYKKYTDSYGGIKKAWQGNPMTEIKILETQFETKTAIVYVIISFEDGAVQDGSRVHFEKINNEWKIGSFSK